MLDREQRIEFNQEVAATTQATVVSLIQTAKNKIKTKPTTIQSQAQQKNPEQVVPPKQDPPKVVEPVKDLMTRMSDSLSKDT